MGPNGGNKPTDFCDPKTGMPWVMHDGYFGTTYNPVMLTLDRAKVDALWDAANPLALAYWFTNETRCLPEDSNAIVSAILLSSQLPD